MASHLLDEVEKVCTHVAILKTGELLITGEVNEVLQDEDVVEAGAADLHALAGILQHFGSHVVVNEVSNTVQFTLSKGTAKLDEINHFCFQKGIVLNHLLLKKKRLETRFFELTN
jgi:ABC-2 type transport system ATP-binding protein